MLDFSSNSHFVFPLPLRFHTIPYDKHSTVTIPLDYNSDEKEQLWVWEYETEDGKHDLFMEVGETIRFKVKEELFTDTLPAGPSSLNVNTPSTGTHQETVEVAQRRIPYLIRGTVNESGLGLNSWWNS